MTRLSGLPTEILELITRALPGGCVIELWSSGDIVLQKKLINGGVTDVRLLDDGISTTSRWPKFLSQLQHLRCLNIAKRSQSLGDAEMIGEELRRLSPTLEELKMSFLEAEECLLQPITSAPRISWLFNEEESDYSAEIQERGRICQGRLWNLAKHFPRLRVLKLETKRVQLYPSDYDNLPNTLLKLRVSWKTELTPELLEKMPRQLKSLRLHTDAFDYKQLELESPLFPPDLRTLKNIQVWGEDMHHLPQNLTFLRIACPNWYDESMAALPQTLKYLHLCIGGSGRMDPSCLGKLPRNLLSYESSFTGIPAGADHTTLDALPKTLTRFLHGLLITDWDLSKVESHHWPPGLKEFSAAVMIDPKKFYSSLPQSLTNLSILDLQFKDSGESLEDQASLQDTLHNDLMRDRWIDHWRQISLANLTQLKSLQISAQVTSFAIPQTDPLPSNITHLTLKIPLDLGANFWKLLPPLLRIFESDTSEQDLRAPDGSYPTPFAGVEKAPKSLEIITLASLSVPLAPLAFCHLPRGLLSLNLDDLNQEFTEEDTRGLPPGITSLKLHQAKFKNSASVEGLPRSITELKLGSCGDPGSCIHLPAKLRRLSIQYAQNLEEQHLARLPRSLTSLTLSTFNLFLPTEAYRALPPNLRFVWAGHLGAKYRQLKSHWERPLPTPDPRVIARLSSPQ